uniref:Uncharacterized protein n=1 Tax=Timema genevievae TaxID=629358 RepID=A0A7R9JX52_TIMGE|nr:unnamed protein product [Timema genevievae]
MVNNDNGNGRETSPRTSIVRGGPCKQQNVCLSHRKHLQLNESFNTTQDTICIASLIIMVLMFFNKR